MTMNIDYSNGMKAAELYICDGDIEEYNTNFYSINLFVKNQKGYHNLCKLTSIAMTKGYIMYGRNTMPMRFKKISGQRVIQALS